MPKPDTIHAMIEPPLQPTQDLDLHSFSGVSADCGAPARTAQTSAEEAGDSAPCTFLDRVLVWLTVLALLASAAASLFGTTP